MKVFWKDVRVTAAAEGGFAVSLDARQIRTPAKAALSLPTEALAEALAAEWRAQTGDVHPERMPLTRAANSAIDRVTPGYDAVASDLAGYGGSDLLCYRAPHPEALAARQAAAWDPLLAWAAEDLGVRLAVTTGVMHLAQDDAALAALAGVVRAHDAWALTALHDLVVLSGSLILALAVSRGRLDAETAWRLSRIDETWNVETWGADAEAEVRAERQKGAFLEAERLLQLLRS